MRDPTAQALPLSPAKASDAGKLIARSFFDDPMFLFSFPDEEERRAALPMVTTMGVLGRLGDGEVWASPGELRAVAAWRTPDSIELPLAEGVAELLEEFGRAASRESRRRFQIVLQNLKEETAAFGTQPRWYLAMLAVEPGHQGQGLGGKLISGVLTRADEAGMECHLETLKPRNVRFYEQHGFSVAKRWDIPEGGPTVWAMIREPRRVYRNE